MHIIGKIVDLEVLFSILQKLAQSDIGVKRYDQNIDAVFQWFALEFVRPFWEFEHSGKNS